MRKLWLKVLFQNNPCADYLLVPKVPNRVDLPVFLLDLEIAWSPVLLLWSIRALRHAEWGRLQERGCLEVPRCIDMPQQAGTPSQSAESLRSERRKFPQTLSHGCVPHLWTAERCAASPKGLRAPWHGAPLPAAVEGTHSHPSCTTRALRPGQSTSLGAGRCRSETSDWGGVEPNVSISWENALSKKPTSKCSFLWRVWDCESWLDAEYWRDGYFGYSLGLSGSLCRGNSMFSVWHFLIIICGA